MMRFQIAGFVALLCVGYGAAYICYECTTDTAKQNYTAACADVGSADDPWAPANIAGYEVNCELGCKKDRIEVNIFGITVVVYTRGCVLPTDGAAGCNDWQFIFKGHTCICHTDKCNSGTTLAPVKSLIVMAILTIIRGLL